MEESFTEIDYDDIDEGKILGKGSYGVVLRGWWRSKSIEVAVKVFQTEIEHKAFFIELKQLSRLKHPHIIQLYGASTIRPPFFFLVMEYAECGSLYKVLHQIKPQISYHSGHALSWCLQCAQAVNYLHNLPYKPLIHRDIKSPNLLLVKDGLILKVCDFGTACDKKTIMTNNKGSAAWMAPEVFEGNTYTEKCDVFSWGIIMWEVLTRRLPFEEIGGNDFRILWAIYRGQRPPPISNCPELLENLMNRCWDQDVQVRPTMREVIDCISPLIAFFPLAVEPLIIPPVADELEVISNSNHNSINSYSFESAQSSQKFDDDEDDEVNPGRFKRLKSAHHFFPKLTASTNSTGYLRPPPQLFILPNEGANPLLDILKSPKSVQKYGTPPEDIGIPTLPQIDPLSHLSHDVLNRRRNRLKSVTHSRHNKLFPTSNQAETIPLDIRSIINLPCQENRFCRSPEGSNQLLYTERDSSVDYHFQRQPLYDHRVPRYPLSDYVARSPVLNPIPVIEPSSAPMNRLCSDSCWLWQSEIEQEASPVDVWPQGVIPFDTLSGRSYPRRFKTPYLPLKTSTGDLVTSSVIDQTCRVSPCVQPSVFNKERRRRSSSCGSSFDRCLLPPSSDVVLDSDVNKIDEPYSGSLRRCLSSSNDSFGFNFTHSEKNIYCGPQDAYFKSGRRQSVVDRAVEMLEPEMRPVPPQTNCTESMMIYEDHRLMAAEYMDLKTEREKLECYKRDLLDRITKNKQSSNNPETSDVQMQSERDVLLQFREKLSNQLRLIREHLNSESKGDEKSHAETIEPETEVVENSWVLVGATNEAK